jgi:4a-hydroxytetrahydrobiopterin dehydratase
MPLTLDELLTRACQPLRGAPLDAAAVQAQLDMLPAWRCAEGVLVRSYRFANYDQTIDFVNALADLARREDHHPELRVTYDRCEVRFDTHSVGGISANDFICAAKTDALYALRFSA